MADWFCPGAGGGQAATGAPGEQGAQAGGEIRGGDLDVAVIGDQLHPRAASAHLPGDRVALAGAGDRQIQLGLNIPVFRGCLQLEAGTLRARSG